MENKKEMNLEDFVTNGWTRLKQLMHAQSLNIQAAENPVEENDKPIEGEDQEESDNEDENEPVEDEIKYAETNDELNESQYDEETKLIVEGNELRQK